MCGIRLNSNTRCAKLQSSMRAVTVVGLSHYGFQDGRHGPVLLSLVMQLVCFLMALAPVCVWIGGTNRWMRGQSGGADSFLSPGWIKEKAHMQDLGERSGTGVDILGVAQIIPGASYTIMKSFSREWKVLHAFFGRPLDSYSVIVTKAYQSTSPATIYTKMRSNKAKTCAFQQFASSARMHILTLPILRRPRSM